MKPACLSPSPTPATFDWRLPAAAVLSGSTWDGSHMNVDLEAAYPYPARAGALIQFAGYADANSGDVRTISGALASGINANTLAVADYAGVVSITVWAVAIAPGGVRHVGPRATITL